MSQEINSLREYTNAVVAELVAKLPEGVTVDLYDRQKTEVLKTPGVYIELQPVAEGEDQGEGKQPVVCEMTAYCVLNTATNDVELEVAEMSVVVMKAIRRNRFGLGRAVNLPEGIESGEAFFSTPKGGLSSRYVGWSQALFLGESVWKGEALNISEIYIGVAPDIGLDHKDDYERVPVNE